MVPTNRQSDPIQILVLNSVTRDKQHMELRRENKKKKKKLKRI